MFSKPTIAPTLSDSVMPLIAFVRQFQTVPEGTASAVATQFEHLITAARAAATAGGFTEEDSESALFAVLAWADEALLASTWKDASAWSRHLLQKRYFNVSTAGVVFFVRLDSLKPEQLQVREVYLLCLGLGFAGRYGYERDSRALTDIKQHSLRLLLQAGDELAGDTQRLLFPDSYGNATEIVHEKKSHWRERWRFSALSFNAVTVPLLALAVMYVVYHTILWRMANTLLQQIK